MEFRLLGPVEAVREDRSLPLPGAKPRALLAFLLIHANEVVSRDRLIEALWPERAPGTAGHSLDVQVSRLRKVFEPEELLATRSGGYVLEVDPDAIDISRFEGLLEEGRTRECRRGARRGARMRSTRHSACGAGVALADLAYEDFARTEIERLDELRLVAIEERIDAQLALGSSQRTDPRAGDARGRAPAARAAPRAADARPLPVRDGRPTPSGCTATLADGSSKSSGSSRGRGSRTWNRRSSARIRRSISRVRRQLPARRRIAASAFALAAAGVAAAAVVMFTHGGTENAQARRRARTRTSSSPPTPASSSARSRCARRPGSASTATRCGAFRATESSPASTLRPARRSRRSASASSQLGSPWARGLSGSPAGTRRRSSASTRR